MCYRVREPERRQDALTQLPRDDARQPFLRPRVVGAVAAALVAVAATAALLLPSPTPAVSSVRATAATPVAKADTRDRAGMVIEQTGSTLDDGVPSADRDVVAARSSSGPCHHGL